MRLMDALSDFLYDKNYFINIFDNSIHIYRYLELSKLSSQEIILKMEGFTLNIDGENLFIKQMNKDEILINGQIDNIGLSYVWCSNQNRRCIF